MVSIISETSGEGTYENAAGETSVDDGAMEGDGAMYGDIPAPDAETVGAWAGEGCAGDGSIFGLSPSRRRLKGLIMPTARATLPNGPHERGD